MRMQPTSRPDTNLTLRCLTVALLAMLLVACASRTRAPVEDRTAMPPPVATPVPAPAPAPVVAPEPEPRTPTYTVKRGDTLYQIALDHGLDYKELAAWNALENLNLILVGQVLRVTAPGDSTAGVTTTPLNTPPAVTAATGAASAGANPASGAGNTAAATGAKNADNYKSSPKALKEPYSEHAVRDVTRAAQAPPETVAMVAPSSSPKVAVPGLSVDADDQDRQDWVWPAKGRVVVTFSETANLKGIDIAGTSGDAVIAAAPGKVVYVGNGLRGYGKLVIVKHNKTWLSAYAHNREILVKEGQQVTRGQKIAEMGNTDADQVKLHFEIRRLGKPVDPARYLPAG